jgi:hypothetical protein
MLSRKVRIPQLVYLPQNHRFVNLKLNVGTPNAYPPHGRGQGATQPVDQEM